MPQHEPAVQALVIDARQAQAGAKVFEKAMSDVQRANRSVVAATERVEQTMTRLGRQVTQVTARVDPASRAMAQMERAERVLDTAAQRGIITFQEKTRVLRLYEQRLEALSLTAANTNTAISSSADRYRQIGTIAQQAGYQVGDFAVQVASGTNPLVAFTQQASQLLGIFGPWGAVAGAALAVTGGLALAFTRSADSAGNAADATDLLNEAIEKGLDITQTAEERSRRLAEEREREARETFKAALAEKQLNEARLSAQRLEALESLNETELGLDRMSERDRAFAEADPALKDRLRRDRQEVERLTEELRIAREETEYAAQRFAQFLNAPRPNESGGGSAARVRDVADALRETADPLQEYIRSLSIQNDLLRLEADERERVEAVMRAQNIAMAEGNLLTPEQIQHIRDLVTESQRLRGAQTDLTDKTVSFADAVKDSFQGIGDTISRSIANGENAFKSLGNVAEAVLTQITARMIELSIVNPLLNAIPGLGFGLPTFGGLPFMGANEDGNAFDRGRVVPFANGGAFTNRVVASPTVAPMALFGEAGPEAIMPLKRGPDGKLGVAASGGGNVQINIIDQRQGGEPIQTRERQGPDGTRTIDVLVRESLNRMAGNGQLDRVLEPYGARRQGVRR